MKSEIINRIASLRNFMRKHKLSAFIIPSTDPHSGEYIPKHWEALKKFKRKFEKTGVVKELRARQQFDKPSVLNRLKRERAIYVQKLQQVEE